MVIGASDTSKMVMGLDSKGFQNWWKIKTGEVKDSFVPTVYTITGNAYESHILDSLGLEIERDKQIVVSEHFVVNLDGNTTDTIYEVKTSSYENVFWGKTNKGYIQQVNVQMYATGIRKAFIVYYGLLPDDYDNLFAPEIDSDRLLLVEVEYDSDWIENTYKPRLALCERCLDSGEYPWEVEE
jgi:hypothetical protein